MYEKSLTDLFSLYQNALTGAVNDCTCTALQR